MAIAAQTDDVSLLREPAISVNRSGYWEGDVPISARWSVGIKGAGKLGWDDDRGLCLSWQKGADRIRLLQEIDPRDLPPGQHGSQISLQMVFPADFDARAGIQWAAILHEEPDSGHTFFAKLPITTTKIGKKIIALSATQIPPCDPARRYFFCVQFEPSLGEAWIRSVNLTASALTAYDLRRAQIGTKPAPAPTPPTPPKEPAAREAPREIVREVPREAPREVPRREEPVAVAAKPVAAKPPAAAPAPARRPKAIVIAWDMGHNPVGRAYLLADMLKESHDVELIGPLFKRYGGKVWQPIRDSSIPFRAFPAEKMQDYVQQALAFVVQSKPDIVIACKARLPSMVLGMLIKYHTGCPVIIDVDDHELSFFANRDPIAIDEVADAMEMTDADLPFGEGWTRLSETLIGQFDGVIVSNVALQDRFGGTVVRHARDEDRFTRDDRIRERVRTEFGYTPDDRVILFLGTPRAHKGVFRIAEAIEALGLPNLALCIVGSANDKRIENRLTSYKARIKLFPDQPWERLPDLINLADGVCLLQDPASAIADYQIPAKLTDALATGVPVAVTDVKPLSDIPSPRVVVRIDDEADLQAFLTNVSTGAFASSDTAQRARSFFLGELSYAVNGARLGIIIAASTADKKPWPADWTRLFGLINRGWQTNLPEIHPEWSETQIPFPAIVGKAKFDIAFFWKQNDSGIYGRRHDMLVKYLAQHPRVGKIIQFDAPIDSRNVERMIRLDEESFLDQANLVTTNTIRRYLRVDDDANVLRRVFVHHGKRATASFLGQPLLPEEDYVDWVRATIREAGSHNAVASWVAPVVFDYPQIHDAMRFSLSIADIIDDQRAMPSTPAHHTRLCDSYAETLRRVDVAFANCEAAKAAFGAIRSDVVVVPNAAELERNEGADIPAGLAALNGPIIGYVGNLRDRIDVDLIELIATTHPEWQIVLIGSAHRSPEVLRLRSTANVHFLGVKAYETAKRYIRGFDVAIMPHLDNAVSQAMNPLKLYVYVSLGVPIVSTAVANIHEITDFATVTNSHQEFVAGIERHLAEPRKRRAKPVARQLTWPARVDAIMAELERR